MMKMVFLQDSRILYKSKANLIFLLIQNHSKKVCTCDVSILLFILSLQIIQCNSLSFFSFCTHKSNLNTGTGEVYNHFRIQFIGY